MHIIAIFTHSVHLRRSQIDSTGGVLNAETKHVYLDRSKLQTSDGNIVNSALKTV